MSSRSENKHIRSIKAWDRWEKLIKRLLIVFLMMLMVAQLMDKNLNIKIFQNKTKQLEGKSVIENQPLFSNGSIQLSIENNSGDLSSIYILINGEKVTHFTKNTVQLSVRNNDIIEISSVGNANKLRVKILQVDDNILFPNAGKIIALNNNLVTVGRVRLK